MFVALFDVIWLALVETKAKRAVPSLRKRIPAGRLSWIWKLSVVPSATVL